MEPNENMGRAESSGIGTETDAITSESAKSDVVVDIFIDTSADKVIGWDAEGRTLRFVPTNGVIKELGKELVEALSSRNRANYTYAYGEMMFDQKHRAPAPPPEIVIDVSGASARMKMEIKGGSGRRIVWKARRNIEKFLQMGWKVCSADDVKTYGRTAGPHRIKSTSEPGVDDLVAMEMPAEQWKKWNHRDGSPKSISSARVKGFNQRSVDALKEAGGFPFLEDERSGIKFKELKENEDGER